jgi:hypothetical protein
MANDAGPEAKQWALAATAILTTLTRREPRHDLLGGAAKSPEAEGTARTILANSWGVADRNKLIATLEWLGGTGHSAAYQQQAAAFAAAPPPQRQQDPQFAFLNQFGAEIGPRGLAAWDLGRLLAVAGWGYLAGFCSEDEAWGASLSAGVRIRGTYGSWEEYGRHYRLGATFAEPATAGQLDQVLAHLSSAPNSPWKTTAWSLDGAPGMAPTPLAPPVAAGAPPQQYGGVPVISPAGAPPGAVTPPAPGAPAYGAPPGQPGAPMSYGGVPVIAPPPGGGPPPPGMGGGGKSKMGLIIGVAAGGFFFLVLLIFLIVHFMHRSHEHEHREAPPPAHNQPKHGH